MTVGFESIVLTIWSLLTVILGVIGNSYSLYYFITVEKSKKVGRDFLIALSACDILIMLIFPLNEIFYQQMHMGFMEASTATCRIFYFLFFILVDTSHLLIELLALERVISIKFPLKRSILYGTNKAICLGFGAIYLVGKAIMSAFVYQKVENKTPICVFIDDWEMICYLHHFIFVLQSSLMDFTASVYIHGVFSTETLETRRLSKVVKSKPNRFVESQIKYMLGVSVLTMLLTVIPACFMVGTSILHKTEKQRRLIKSFIISIYLTNNVIHFLTHTVNSDDYKQQMIHMFYNISRGIWKTNKTQERPTRIFSMILKTSRLTEIHTGFIDEDDKDNYDSSNSENSNNMDELYSLHTSSEDDQVNIKKEQVKEETIETKRRINELGLKIIELSNISSSTNLR